MDDIFLYNVIHYLPFTLARSICKLPDDINNSIIKRALQKFIGNCNRIRQPRNQLNYIIDNRTISHKSEYIKILVKEILENNVDYINDYYLYSWFGITLDDLYNLIRIEMAKRFGNGIFLTDHQIYNELGMFLDTTLVLDLIE